MKYFFLYIAFFASTTSFSQVTATVDVTFENSPRKDIEKRSFFKFNKVPDNFEKTRLADNRYLINYLDSVPSIIFINFRPILITPGDHVNVTYKVLISSYEQMIDVMYATGRNAQNYTFSNFFNSKLIPGDSFPDLRDVRYQTNSTLLYTDLVKAYRFRDQHYESNLKKQPYQSDISSLLKRMNHIEFLSNALSLATELGEQYKQQYPLFAKKIDEAFRNTNFIAKDINYFNRMEEVLYSYFWHLYNIRFLPIDSKENTEALIKFIKDYPEPFVRDYFIFFLSTDLNGIVKKYASADYDELLKSISNLKILNELKGNQKTTIN